MDFRSYIMMSSWNLLASLPAQDPNLCTTPSKLSFGILEFGGSFVLEERCSWMKDVQDQTLKTQDKSQDDMFITSSTVIRGFTDDDA